MDSESDHDHRDDESVASEPEEVEEVKPKSALKKSREVLPPAERPELPYVFISFILILYPANTLQRTTRSVNSRFLKIEPIIARDY